MVFNATFNNISVIYRGCQFDWWRKAEYPEKTTELPQVTDKLSYIMLYRASTSLLVTHTYAHNIFSQLSTIFQLYRGGSVLLVEETGIPGENHRPVASHYPDITEILLKAD
jgi:kynureninase